jgi:hypothetical protein
MPIQRNKLTPVNATCRPTINHYAVSTGGIIISPAYLQHVPERLTGYRRVADLRVYVVHLASEVGGRGGR